MISDEQIASLKLFDAYRTGEELLGRAHFAAAAGTSDRDTTRVELVDRQTG